MLSIPLNKPIPTPALPLKGRGLKGNEPDIYRTFITSPLKGRGLKVKEPDIYRPSTTSPFRGRALKGNKSDIARPALSSPSKGENITALKGRKPVLRWEGQKPGQGE